jgi:hypothetical protein
MAKQIPSCFLEKVWNLRRGGADLVAESESLFSKEVFVFHPKDIEFLQKLVDMQKEQSFLMMIIGIPGVGKTALLLSLLRDEQALPENIRSNNLWKTVREMYSFMNLSTPLSAKRDPIRRNVWVVPTVDEYYSPTSGEKMTGLLNDLSRSVKQDDSILLAGNQGMFMTQPGERDPRNKIIDVVATKTKNKKLETIILEPWIKEYGGVPSTEHKKSFQEFSKEIIEFVIKHLMTCYKNGCTSGKAQTCSRFQDRLQEMLRMIKEGAFIERLYDLMCSMRLRHQDIYLTPRALLVFWADFSSNLLQRLSSSDKGIIYEAIFESCLISSLYSRSYKLHETNLDIFRSQEIDALLKKRYSDAMENGIKRRASRLKIYFEGEIDRPYRMIYDCAYADFINQQNSSDVLKKVFRFFFVYADKRFQRKLTEAERIVESGEWLPYTFLTESWMRTKKEFITNMGAIEDFIDKYSPVSVEPIDFEKRSRKVVLSIKEAQSKKPHFYVDLETFLPFLMLSKGFYVDFSLYPSILAKIEIVLSELRDIFRPFLLKWFEKHISEPERMAHTYISADGLLTREEKPWI